MALADIQDSQLARRSREYWNVDGIPVLVGGVLYLGVVGCLIVLIVLMNHADFFAGNWVVEFLIKPLGVLAFMISPLWIILAVIWLSVNWEDVIEWFKVRLTYRRTGYVAPPSYWQNEPAKSANPQQESRLSQWLSTLGSFWFWASFAILLDVLNSLHLPWDFSPSRRGSVALLGVLLAIRGLRFGVYPETPIVDGGRKRGILLQVVRLLRSVLKPFWVRVWVWGVLIGLLSSAVGEASPWPVMVLALSLPVFLILLPRVGPLFAACLCLCVPACAFLFWRGSLVSIVTAFLVPGLCAVFVGALRLYRYLRANPVRSA